MTSLVDEFMVEFGQKAKEIGLDWHRRDERRIGRLPRPLTTFLEVAWFGSCWIMGGMSIFIFGDSAQLLPGQSNAGLQGDILIGCGLAVLFSILFGLLLYFDEVLFHPERMSKPLNRTGTGTMKQDGSET